MSVLKRYNGTDWEELGGTSTSLISSVNGQTGTVVLDGADINVDDTATTPQTIKAAITSQSTEIVALESDKQDKITTATASLTVAGWSSSSQTVSVSGVTASNSVIVSPAPASYDDYTVAEIKCTAQASGTLTFACGTTPTSAITVNVMIVG